MLSSRKAVLELTSAWRFAYAAEVPGNLATAIAATQAGLAFHPCEVPGNFELDLHRLGVIGDPFQGGNMEALRQYETCHVLYHNTFSTPQRPAGHRAILVFGGIDCFAEVFLNGTHLGSCNNMLVPWEFDVTEAVADGANELFVHLRPAVPEAKMFAYPSSLRALPSNLESVHVRKAPHMYGWDIMPRAVSAGLWRPVHLRFDPPDRLEEVYLATSRLAPNRATAALRLHFRARLHSPDPLAYRIEVKGCCGDSRFQAARTLAFEAGCFEIPLAAPVLWWPRGAGSPSLYDVTVRLFRGDCCLDEARFRHGVRTIQLERTSTADQMHDTGRFQFIVNGETIFAKGSNWVPLDAFHSRDAGRLETAFALVTDLECNMLRCWGGNVYESDRFYDLCDENGVMVWQDFTMACAVYPQDAAFQKTLDHEARLVIRRLRQHPAVMLWAGDNECDVFWTNWGVGNPNRNVLTRETLPRAIHDEDGYRPYLPSSPYMDEAGFAAGDRHLSENHLWGPRDYLKSEFYRQAPCRFASEIGYHGCPAPESVQKFISPAKVWPYQDNREWILHSTCPLPGWLGQGNDDSRVLLMANQVRELFGTVPDTLEAFAFASQASQAEAKKFFIEMFRAAKWRRTGILWWNLLDGWPQFSDAVVDYYFTKKLAYTFIKRSQAHLCLILREPADWRQELVACNDLLTPVALSYTVRDLDTGTVLATGNATAAANAVTPLTTLPFSLGSQRFYLLEWTSPAGTGKNHYVAGTPPYPLARYRDWLAKAGLH